MNVITVNITFNVSDVEEAVKFYEQVLGLRKKNQWHDYAVFDLCGTMLGLQPAEEKAEKGMPDVYLQVDDVDQTCRELKSKNVRFLSEPKDQSWGARTAKFADAFGNTFTLLQLKR